MSAAEPALQPVDSKSFNCKTKNEQAEHHHFVFFNVYASVEQEKNSFIHLLLLIIIQIHLPDFV